MGFIGFGREGFRVQAWGLGFEAFSRSVVLWAGYLQCGRCCAADVYLGFIEPASMHVSELRRQDFGLGLPMFT